jgi:16S rRNA (cytosine1402-N4)-methyltransferase
MNEASTYHTPVLLKESIEKLNVRPGGIYIDATFGGGSHSKEILIRLENQGHLYGFDQDEDAEKNSIKSDIFTFVRSNFRYLDNFMEWNGVKRIDGLLADLGVSSHHLDNESRGFSFRFDSKLDMRMNKKADKTAVDVLNTYRENELSNIFYLYGELRHSRIISKNIIQARNDKKIQTVQNLLDILQPFLGKEKQKKFLAQVFQALRIEVNGEIDALKEMLEQASRLLKPSGRMAVITYHSLEDRLVKNFFKAGNFEGDIEKDFYGNKHSPFKIINNKVITPCEEEIKKNPRSRSAKLRIVEKI